MTVLVTFHLTVSALVALFAQSSRESSFADFAYGPPRHVFRNECVIVEYVKLRTLFPPFALLGERKWHEIMLFNTVLKGFENEGRSLVDIGSSRRSANAGRFAQTRSSGLFFPSGTRIAGSIGRY